MSEDNNMKPNEFVAGVLDAFSLGESEDIVVIGRVKGTIRINDRVYITNIGDDDDEVIVLNVVALEINKKLTDSATDELVGIKIGNAKGENIKVGSVLHSLDVDENSIRNAYVNALADSYVGKRKMEIEESQYIKMSIADCAETWRLYSWIFMKEREQKSEAETVLFKSNLGMLGKMIAKKILLSDEIYVVYSKATREPFMFSRTFTKDNGFLSSPPMIKIFPKAYLKLAKENFDKDKFELKKIDKSENEFAIEQFLRDTFKYNGALGAQVIFDQVEVSSEAFFKEMKEDGKEDSFVANPDLVRWILLSSQIGSPKTEDEKQLSRLYFNHFSRELMKAKFLVPMKSVQEYTDPDENGNRTKKGVRITFPGNMGKDGHKIMFLYSDIKRLRSVYNEEWEVSVQTAEAFIKEFNLVINHIDNVYIGLFVNKEMYEAAKNIAGKSNS